MESFRLSSVAFLGLALRNGSMRRSWLATACYTSLCLLTAAEVAYGQTKEYRLKAAFLYNFAKFVEWPSERYDTPQSPFVIGVLGHNPFGNSLAATVKGRRVNGRAVVVKHFNELKFIREAHLLFVSESSQELWHERRNQLPHGILVVGETEWFANHGGTITFLLHEDKLRFKINMQSATAENLKVSAQLQKLATHVTK